MRKSVLIGILSALFFATTFVVNRSLNLSGDNFLWTSSLRFIFTFIILVPFMKKASYKRVFNSIQKNPIYWLVNSTIGFGIFYTCVSLGSIFGESWLVASLWQLTIICGILLTPLFGSKIPRKPLLLSLFILLGVGLLQVESFQKEGINSGIMLFIIMLIAAICYPLGNRMMMKLVKGDLSTLERTFGMTLMSLPYWFILSSVGLVISGPPSSGQLVQSFVVALFAGVIGTILFFKATDMESHNPHGLALVEATQSGEVVFSLIGGVLILGDHLPSLLGFVGIGLIILGNILSSVITSD